ncbi:MAG: glutaredoxin family protein [Bryobacterales bacterium]|jgi:glutaredoxin|nr:glutaredoxin family protein [Bryobacterales bacterium]
MSDQHPSPKPSIILYSQPYCPACRRAKEFLSQHLVAFQELDVSEDYDARDDLWEVYGSQNTPTLVIDGEAFIGFRREAWATRLGIAGKP